jgi:predicted acylesterase/phospholipase RssA
MTNTSTRIEYVDGSLHADIPVQRLSELFNAQVFIVSQVNPHVAPFLTNTARIHGHTGEISYSILAAAEKSLASDISHRLGRLSKLKIIPKVYGQDFRPIFDGRQRYTGR